MSVEIPGYKILRTLGRGGMATVYLAIQEVFEREVALKVMSKVLAEDPNFGQRFFREAKIVSKLVHPNIVTVHDVGMQDGYCYLSMEYIDGQDLKRVNHRFGLREKIRTIRDIAKALDYAGKKGYVHRDIKPENIMFHSSDGRAVLMDFGIARAAESDTQVTQTGTAIGTPHYMSPEQAKGKTVDSRSDIYSLGVVFYYILAGRVPYDAESAVAIGIKHITEPVPLLPKAYESLQPIIDHMMAKDVTKRYQNAKELIADLDHLDLDVLEHTVEFASSSAAKKSDEMPTIAHTDDADVEAFETDEQLVDVSTFDYEVEEVKEKVSVLPWLFAGTFVVAVVAVFVHFKNPAFFAPVIEFVNAKKEQLAAPEPTPAPRIAKAPTTAVPTSTPFVENKAPENLASGQITRNATKDSAPAQVPTSVPEAPVQENLADIAALKQKVDRLKEAYASDDIYLSELVSAHRELMSAAPDDRSIAANFDDFRQKEIAKLVAHAEKNGTSSSLTKRINQLQSLFPEEEQSAFDNVLAKAKQRKRVMTLILEAEAYLKQNNLTRPPGRNALDIYDKVISLDRDNNEARDGKKLISKRLSEAAATKYAAKQYESAMSSVKTSLKVDPTNQQAQRLERELGQLLDKNQRIASLLRAADVKISKGQLFTPSKQGAFHDYQTVLTLDPNNGTARAGLDRVVDALSAKVWQLVGDEQFLQAKELMRAPLREYGSNDRIKSLSLAVDEVIGDKILDAEPRIEGMLIKGEPIQNLTDRPGDVFAADRSIFLGFRYENFQTNTTVIQAVLMDGARRIQIAQVPVVVEGEAGQSTFRIDRPVEGFPSGSYSIEMRIGADTLNSTLFKVK